MLSGHRPDQMDQGHCKAMSKWCRLYKGKLLQMYQGSPQGCCSFSQFRWPADLLAFYGQEACSHTSCQCTSSCSVKCSFSATLRVATSIKRWKYHSAREEWKNLLCAAQGTSIQVCRLEQDGAYWPPQAYFILQAVSSIWQGNWRSQEDHQGQEAAKREENGSSSCCA